MAGTFVGVAGIQQLQLSGSAPPFGSVPMAGGTLTVYNASTSTLSSVFQDIGLAIPATNPLVLDRTGRVPQFYVADGFYRLRLADITGVINNGGFDYPSVPSIGASSSGGSGSGIDPTTVLSTGDVKWQPIQGTIAGWIRMNGRGIGNGASGAGERANADCAALFAYAWNNFSNTLCPVSGGRGANAAADFAAAKILSTLDMRARVATGLDDMGATAAGRLTSVTTGSTTTPGSSGGFESITLTLAQLAAHNHGGVTGNDNVSHTHDFAFPTTKNFSGGTNNSGYAPPTTLDTTGGINNFHQHSIPLAGSNASHNNMPPFILGSFFWKL